ncbi:helix-turn-helix domain-containing protein [Staphylococcus pettenkoferi]|uniref:helix-turn-helix domain-containing protein n=1 Tax=Staphylococcus pettenkoferi TaxID=170573 RepID=UPI00119EDEC7|nr:helix-turn-helix transcriptional regulator [Staphylococcus pettenkoferi]
MKRTKAISYKAKPKQIKLAVIDKEITLKKLAEATNSGYITIVQISTGAANTSELRAKSIAKFLNKSVEDLFTEVN